MEGIFVSSPQMCYGAHFRKGLFIGETTRTEQELKKILVDMMLEWNCNTYDMFSKNCNHFSSTICLWLTGHDIPTWVNKTARFFRYTASLATKKEFQLDVNKISPVHKETKEKEKELLSAALPKQTKDGINFELLKAIDKASGGHTDANLVSWLCDESNCDPFSNNPDALLHKNWVPRVQRARAINDFLDNDLDIYDLVSGNKPKEPSPTSFALDLKKEPLVSFTNNYGLQLKSPRKDDELEGEPLVTFTQNYGKKLETTPRIEGAIGDDHSEDEPILSFTPNYDKQLRSPRRDEIIADEQTEEPILSFTPNYDKQLRSPRRDETITDEQTEEPILSFTPNYDKQLRSPRRDEIIADEQTEEPILSFTPNYDKQLRSPRRDETIADEQTEEPILSFTPNYDKQLRSPRRDETIADEQTEEPILSFTPNYDKQLKSPRRDDTTADEPAKEPLVSFTNNYCKQLEKNPRKHSPRGESEKTKDLDKSRPEKIKDERKKPSEKELLDPTSKGNEALGKSRGSDKTKDERRKHSEKEPSDTILKEDFPARKEPVSEAKYEGRRHSEKELSATLKRRDVSPKELTPREGKAKSPSDKELPSHTSKGKDDRNDNRLKRVSLDLSVRLKSKSTESFASHESNDTEEKKKHTPRKKKNRKSKRFSAPRDKSSKELSSEAAKKKETIPSQPVRRATSPISLSLSTLDRTPAAVSSPTYRTLKEPRSVADMMGEYSEGWITLGNKNSRERKEQAVEFLLRYSEAEDPDDDLVAFTQEYNRAKGRLKPEEKERLKKESHPEKTHVAKPKERERRHSPRKKSNPGESKETKETKESKEEEHIDKQLEFLQNWHKYKSVKKVKEPLSPANSPPLSPSLSPKRTLRRSSAEAPRSSRNLGYRPHIASFPASPMTQIPKHEEYFKKENRPTQREREVQESEPVRKPEDLKKARRPRLSSEYQEFEPHLRKQEKFLKKEHGPVHNHESETKEAHARRLDSLMSLDQGLGTLLGVHQNDLEYVENKVYAMEKLRTLSHEKEVRQASCNQDSQELGELLGVHKNELQFIEHKVDAREKLKVLNSEKEVTNHSQDKDSQELGQLLGVHKNELQFIEHKVDAREKLKMFSGQEGEESKEGDALSKVLGVEPDAVGKYQKEFSKKKSNRQLPDVLNGFDEADHVLIQRNRLRRKQENLSRISLFLSENYHEESELMKYLASVEHAESSESVGASLAVSSSSRDDLQGFLNLIKKMESIASQTAAFEQATSGEDIRVSSPSPGRCSRQTCDQSSES
eukprot:TRINITY_DN1275_c0_g1_i8.p1 TRINITY_DN1275_c0_g1~~TRINITY_DN1275_c0_g1_i8.p1  ORF type:complete len:1273 (+),score=296.24 TRINITY_DN1275_c0_g1_i8:336-4154(+)